MKNLLSQEINRFRDCSQRVLRYYGSYGDETCGVFTVPSKIDHAHMRIVASSGEGWEHVSVSRANRCPNWPEMCQVKRMFFGPDECVIQYHPPENNYVNNHPFCLHLWKPVGADIPQPPEYMVGDKNKTPAETEAFARRLRGAA